MIISTWEVLNALLVAGRRSEALPPKAIEPDQAELRFCRAAVRAVPAVRAERISAIKAALAAAHYRIDAEEVAKKMLERSLVDAIFSRS